MPSHLCMQSARCRRARPMRGPCVCGNRGPFALGSAALHAALLAAPPVAMASRALLSGLLPSLCLCWTDDRWHGCHLHTACCRVGRRHSHTAPAPATVCICGRSLLRLVGEWWRMDGGELTRPINGRSLATAQLTTVAADFARSLLLPPNSQPRQPRRRRRRSPRCPPTRRLATPTAPRCART
jgi:hypothetical protein